MKEWKDVEPKIKAMLLGGEFPCHECHSRIREGQQKWYTPDRHLHHEYCSREQKDRIMIADGRFR